MEIPYANTKYCEEGTQNVLNQTSIMEHIHLQK